MLLSSAKMLLTVFAVTVTSLNKDRTNPIQYSLVEETSASLGNVLEDSFVLNKYNTAKEEFRCTFMGGDQEYFTLDANGDLSTLNPVDRDQLCPNEVYCNIILDIQVLPIQYFEILKVNITIVDINDEWPLFDDSVVFVTVSENAVVGSSIALPRAVDNDSPEYGIMLYRIMPENSPYELSSTGSQDDEEHIYIVTKDALDREVKESTHLTLIAYDGGYPPKSGAIQIVITIEDSNDNPPKFLKETYRVEVLESTPKNTIILTLSATDPDLGLAGVINYSLSLKSKEDFGDLISLNAETGNVTLIDELDYEKINHISIRVLAQNVDGGSLASQASIEINVIDVNDNIPDIFLPDGVGDGDATPHFETLEESPIGSYVFHFSTDDLDSGDNGIVNCSTKNSGFQVQRVDSTEFKVVNTIVHDRERTLSKGLLLTCNDSGSPVLSSDQYVIIDFIDANDHSPQFATTYLIGKSIQNNVSGAYVATVRAEDEDIGDNGLFGYSIQAPLDSFFNIDTLNGNISTAVDHIPEALQQFNLTILAIDRGSPTQTGTAQVQINLDGVPPNQAQQTEKGFHQCTVLENVSPGTVVCSLAGSPAIPALYKALLTIGYNIEYESINDLPLSIESSSGRIVTSGAIDRESVNSFTFEVMLKLTYASLKSSDTWPLKVVIMVEDKNDNPPEFIFPNSLNNSISITENTTIGDKLATIRATDADLGRNADLSFELLGAAESRIFRIDPTSGELFLRANISSTTQKDRTLLMIKVIDSGKPPKETTRTLIIKLPKALSTIEEPDPGIWDKTLILLIAVAVAGAIVLICGIFMCVVCVRCKRRKNKKKRDRVKMAAEAQNLAQARYDPNQVPDLVWMSGNGESIACGESYLESVSSSMTGAAFISSQALPKHLDARLADAESLSSSFGFDVQSRASTSDSGRGSSVPEHGHVRQRSYEGHEPLHMTLWNNPIPEDDYHDRSPRQSQAAARAAAAPLDPTLASHYASDYGLRQPPRPAPSGLTRSVSAASGAYRSKAVRCRLDDARPPSVASSAGSSGWNSDTYIRKPRKKVRPEAASDSELYKQA
ncbi:hypothetical protein CAPTEDRAFT_228852, partial [Capitella teleta]